MQHLINVSLGLSEARLTQPPSIFKLPAAAQEAVSFKTINRSCLHKPYKNKNEAFGSLLLVHMPFTFVSVIAIHILLEFSV